MLVSHSSSRKTLHFTPKSTAYSIPGLLRLDNGHRLLKQPQAHEKGARNHVPLEVLDNLHHLLHCGGQELLFRVGSWCWRHFPTSPNNSMMFPADDTGLDKMGQEKSIH